MQVSYRYRHLPGLYRTCRILFANTGLVPFQYLHADTYNLQANVFWPSTVLLSACRYLFLTSKYLLARYHLDTGTPIHPHVTGKYLLAWNRFAISIPVPTSYWQISSGPVPFCRQHTDTNILLANIIWPGTILPSTYRYQHRTGKYLLAQYHFALSILVPVSYWQISSGPVPFCPQRTSTSSVPANIFWPSTILPLAYWYRYLTGKYLLAQCRFALSVPVPAVYRQISSGPVPFCPQYTSTNILPETIYWPSTNLLSAYW